MEVGKPQLRATSRNTDTADRKSGWIAKLKSTATQRAKATARLAAATAVISAVVGAAVPAAAEDLVTNLNRASLSADEKYSLSQKDFAQGFNTGPNISGYLLESVTIEFAVGGSRRHDPVYVGVWENEPSNPFRPSSSEQVAHLTRNGHDFEGPEAGPIKYSVRSRGLSGTRTNAVHLEPETLYYVTIWAGEDATTAQPGFTDSENQSGELLWTITDYVARKPEGTANTSYVTHGGRILKLKVKGTTNPEVLVSISDATGTEGTDATMDFVASLDAATSGTVSVICTTRSLERQQHMWTTHAQWGR